MGVARAVFFCTFIAFGGFLFGYDIGCLIMPDFIQRFGTPVEGGGFELGPNRESEITALLSAGTFFGALAQAFFADRFGRRLSIFGWAVIFTIGVVIQTSSSTAIGQLLAGRFIAGLGVGALSAIVPGFAAEAAPKHLRGTLLVLYQTQIAFGLFISYVINLGTHHLSGSAAWRIPVGLQLLFGLVISCGILLLPESPRHSLYIGDTERARRTIATLNSCSVEDPLVNDIMAELDEGIRAENDGGKATWFECFSKSVRHRTINGMMLMFFQQLNGQNFAYFYGPTFFASAGTGLDSFEIQAVLGGVSFAMIFPALYLIETLGRRSSMLIGSVTESICALIAGLVGHFLAGPKGATADELSTQQKMGSQVVIAFVILQVAFFSTFWGPTPWTYLGESFPQRVRSKCIALGTASNWFWNFMLSYFAPRIANDIGSLILLIFCGVLVAAFIYVYFFVPETKGLSLEQVDEMYRSKVKPWHSANWQPTLGQSRKKAFQADTYPSQRGDAASDITAVTGGGKDKHKFAPDLSTLQENEKSADKPETEMRELA
ncbi:hypothetical protein OIV83_003566 [Microbotryomycetes sp. JL201]|nr:hypothetical protein OIV83_003566 [Microbotryomycetes sp. JL201]